MDLHVSFTKPKEGILPDGIDGYLLDSKSIDRIETIEQQIAETWAEDPGTSDVSIEADMLKNDEEFLLFDRLWDIAYQLEKEDPYTEQSMFHFNGGKGLLVSDPEWDGSDSMPLKFKDDVQIHIHGNQPEQLFYFVKEVLSHTDLNITFENAPEINISLTDHYEIAGATDGFILPKDMSNDMLTDTEALRSTIIDTLSEKIEDIMKENSPVSSVKLNIYATGPKTATVEAFNSIQVLANALQENGISLQADFMHLDRETGEYFPQKVELACEHKIAPSIPNTHSFAKGVYPETVNIVFEVCENRHGENPLINDSPVYGHEMPKELMTDPERVQQDIGEHVQDMIAYDFSERLRNHNYRDVEYTVSDVASGASMPLVAFLNAMVEQNQEAAVYQYDTESQEYFRQGAITIMYEDVIREIGEKELEIEPPEKDDGMEMEL